MALEGAGRFFGRFSPYFHHHETTSLPGDPVLWTLSMVTSGLCFPDFRARSGPIKWNQTSLSELGRSWQLQSCRGDVQEEEEGWRVPSSTTLENRDHRHGLLGVLVLCFWLYLFFLCGERGAPRREPVWRALFLPPACSLLSFLTSAGKRRLFSGNDCIYYARLRKW